MEIGKTLRTAREEQGISLEAAEQQTKIRKKYLVALEQEEFNIVPGKVYVRGFLRNYARFLGLDGEVLVDQYNDYVHPYPENEELDKISSSSTDIVQSDFRRRYFVIAMIGLALVVGLATLFSGFWGHNNERDISRGTGDKTEMNGPQDNEAEHNDGNLKPGTRDESNEVNNEENNEDTTKDEGVSLELSFNGRCWMRITVDQNIVFEGFAYSGEEKDFIGKESISVHLGNAGVVRAKVNGKEEGYLGEKGQPLKKTFSLNANSDV